MNPASRTVYSVVFSCVAMPLMAFAFERSKRSLAPRYVNFGGRGFPVGKLRTGSWPPSFLRQYLRSQNLGCIGYAEGMLWARRRETRCQQRRRHVRSMSSTILTSDPLKQPLRILAVTHRCRLKPMDNIPRLRLVFYKRLAHFGQLREEQHN